MARKVIIDCDPGIDDAVALTLALFDPRLEVLAVTAVAGNVGAEQASRNVEAIVKLLDPPKHPRLGVATDAEGVPPDLDARAVHGNDGLGNLGLSTSRLAHRHPSEKVIIDTVRQAPEEVTLICLGPLTNVARVMQREPQLTSLIDRIVMMGGSVEGIGNVTPAAEFNMYYDPASAQSVFDSATTKSLIPLDVTERVVFDMSLLDQLPEETTRAGNLLRRIIPFYFRTHRQMGREGFYLHDAVAVMSVLHPEHFQSTEMGGNVERKGELTRGATVFDRRKMPVWRDNMEVADQIDAAAVRDIMIRGMKFAGQSTAD